MAAGIPLKCSCGVVRGVANNVFPGSGMRAVCYCDDCQKFARFLGRDDILDEYGGTEVFQMPPADVKITQGAEQIRCIRLTPKGLHRWYTACCRTPIGNTLSAGGPFVGMIHNFMGDDETIRNQHLGPVQGYAHTRFAAPNLPAGRRQGVPWRLIMRTLSKLLVWKLKGKNRPSPFFDEHGRPVSEPDILS